jgi:acetyltransferase-like isoleucine patch superfamily enzyme
VVILQNVGLSHDDVIGDYTCIAVGVSFSGSVRIGRNCFLGTNSTIVNASVGEGCMIGAGTLILHDVPPGEVWVGNPGRFLKKCVD